MKDIDKLLKSHWGYDSFRPMQRDIIESVISGKDNLVVLPTGGGKSLTFQLPVLALDGLAIVISPLIALMKDQVDSLKNNGISATFINSDLTKSEINRRIVDSKNGLYKFLYLSPERLKSKNLLRHILLMNICLLVVDEAHSISEWGYDFRPSYHNISSFRQLLNGTPVIAVTATANFHVRNDIMKSLNFNNENTGIFISSFERSNLVLRIEKTDSKIGFIKKYLNINKDKCCIIYCRRREKSKRISLLLNEQGHESTYYHGGLDKKTKDYNQNLWINGHKKIMVCTHAFGMGIDKSDVRIIFHIDIPESLEAYVQEIGRAGRDNMHSNCILLYSNSELSSMLHSKSFDPTKGIVDALYDFLHKKFFDKYGLENSFELSLDMIGKKMKLSPDMCKKSLILLSINNHISILSNINKYAYIKIIKHSDFRSKFTESDYKLSLLNFHLGKMMRGRVDIERKINISELKVQCKLDDESFKAKIKILVDNEIIAFKQLDHIFYVKFKDNRKTIDEIQIENRSSYNSNKHDSMIKFIMNNTICRQKKILEYFHEEMNDCGKCDICLKGKNQ